MTKNTSFKIDIYIQICIKSLYIHTYVYVYYVYMCVNVHACVSSGIESSVSGVIRVQSYSFLYAILSFLPCFWYVHLGVRARFPISSAKEQKVRSIVKRKFKSIRIQKSHY